MLSRKKQLAESFLEPFIKLLSDISPNTLTLTGSIPSILFFVFMINKWYILAIIALIGLPLDLLDGMVARKFNKVTKFGGFLDSTFDRISDFLIIASFAFVGLVRWEIVAPLLLCSFLISYIRSKGEQANPNVSFAMGLIERSERLILIAFGLILYIIFPAVIINNFNVAELILLVLLILSIYTILQRIIYAYRKI